MARWRPRIRNGPPDIPSNPRRLTTDPCNKVSGNCYLCQSTTHICKKAGDCIAESLRADGDSEGDEDDEHGVFGGCGAVIMPIEAADQTEQFAGPPEKGRRPYCQCYPLAISIQAMS